MHGKKIVMPDVPAGQDPLTFYRNLRHSLLRFGVWDKGTKNEYDRQAILFKLVNKKLYELTENPIYK